MWVQLTATAITDGCPAHKSLALTKQLELYSLVQNVLQTKASASYWSGMSFFCPVCFHMANRKYDQALFSSRTHPFLLPSHFISSLTTHTKLFRCSVVH